MASMCTYLLGGRYRHLLGSCDANQEAQNERRCHTRSYQPSYRNLPPVSPRSFLPIPQPPLFGLSYHVLAQGVESRKARALTQAVQ